MTTAPDSLTREATDRARRVGIRPDLMATALLAQRGERPFVVEIEDKTAGESFFRVTQEGPSRILYLNQGHPFYETIYDPPGSTRGYRAAVEVLLWTLGLSELDATEETRRIYERERREWSNDLAFAARILDVMFEYPDQRAADAAADEDDDDDDD